MDPGNGIDTAVAAAVDSAGGAYVTGYSLGTGSDYATISTFLGALLPVPLNYQILGRQLVLSWTNAAFSLQSSPAVTGVYTSISGATSPYTNPTSGAQQFFRLKAN